MEPNKTPSGRRSSATVLRLPQVKAKTGLGRSTIYSQQADGSFPPCIRLGARAIGWLESEVDVVLHARSLGGDTNRIKELIVELVAARRAHLAEHLGPER